MERYKITCKNKSILAEGKYRIEYKNGSIVEVTDETHGIMLFEELENAIDFIISMRSMIFIFWMDYYDYSVKKVETLDDEKCPECISDFTDSEDLDGFYRVMNNPEYIFKNRSAYIKHNTIFSPKGTVCCNKIRVIEDIDKKIIKRMFIEKIGRKYEQGFR